MKTARATIKDLMVASDWLTARQISDETGLEIDATSKNLFAMHRDGIIEAKALPGGGTKKLFRIARIKEPMPRGSVRDYITKNPGLTIKQIARGLDCRVGTVNEFIRNAVRDDRIIRTKNEDGLYIHTMREISNHAFGKGNPLRNLFEQCLLNARKQISCN